MQETFEKLRELQGVLFNKHTISQKLAELPRQLSVKSEMLAHITKSRDEKEQQVKALNSQLSSLRLSLAEEQDKRKALEAKMAMVKTQREFEVLEKEINDANLVEEQYHKDSHFVADDLAELQKNLDLDNDLIATQQQELDEAKAKIDSESQSARAEIASLEKQEKELNPGLSAELLAKFEKIIHNKDGIGIVGVKGSICQGCHMVLPLQFVNKVRSATEIHFCPTCSRVLFFEEGGYDFSTVVFDQDDQDSLSDLIDEEDLEEEEEPPLVNSDMAGDYEDN